MGPMLRGIARPNRRSSILVAHIDLLLAMLDNTGALAMHIAICVRESVAAISMLFDKTSLVTTVPITHNTQELCHHLE